MKMLACGLLVQMRKNTTPFYDLDEYIRNGVEYFNLTDYVDHKLNPGEPF